MKKLTLLIAVVLLHTSAIASDAPNANVAGRGPGTQPDARTAAPVVVKDTREYLTYVQPREGAGECFNANCMEQAKVPIGGEYVIRLRESCLAMTFSFDEKSSFYIEGRLVPSTGSTQRFYRCDEFGNAV